MSLRPGFRCHGRGGSLTRSALVGGRRGRRGGRAGVRAGQGRAGGSGSHFPRGPNLPRSDSHSSLPPASPPPPTPPLSPLLLLLLLPSPSSYSSLLSSSSSYYYSPPPPPPLPGALYFFLNFSIYSFLASLLRPSSASPFKAFPYPKLNFIFIFIHLASITQDNDMPPLH